jgi:hypothetical protein
MMHAFLGRAFGGWLAAVELMDERRGMAERSAGRLMLGLAARAVAGWRAAVRRLARQREVVLR